MKNEWMPSRPFTPHELAVLEYLLAGDEPGVPELRAQLPHGRYNGTWVEGSAEFYIEVDNDKCRPSTYSPNAGGGPYVWAEVLDVGSLGLWISDGYLSSLDCNWYTDDMPTVLPALEQIGEVGGGWEPWDWDVIRMLPHNRPRLRDRLMGRDIRGSGWSWKWPKRRR